MQTRVTVKSNSQWSRTARRRVGRTHIGALLLSLVLWTPERAFTAPKMTIDTVVVAPGQATDIYLRLTSSITKYAGFNASIYLPPQVELESVTAGSILPAVSGPYVHQFTVGNKRGVSVVAFSATSSFTAKTGELCCLTIRAAVTAAPGDYPVIFGPAAVPATVNGSHALSSTTGSSIAHTVVDGVLTIRLPGTPEDTNGNGIPDTWEILHFSCITNVTALTDGDSDGLSDYYEYLAGTDPCDASSCLAIHAIDIDASGFVLQWYSIPGAMYTVERGDGPEGLWEFRPIRKNILATPPFNVYTNTPPAVLPAAFFRILLQP